MFFLEALCERSPKNCAHMRFAAKRPLAATQIKAELIFCPPLPRASYKLTFLQENKEKPSLLCR